MRATYLNDTNLVSFPFSASTELPIAPSIIQCLYITVHTSASEIVGNSYAYTASLEVNDTGVAISICLCTVYGDVFLCMTEADYNTSESMSGETTVTSGSTSFTISYHVTLSCGLKDAGCIGSYKGRMLLDPACLIVMQDSDFCSNAGKFMLNGTNYTIGECLYIDSNGMLSDTDKLIPVERTTPGTVKYTIDKNAEVPVDAKMINILDSDGYSMVEKINGVSFTPSSKRTRKLIIDIEPPASSKTGTNAASYITCSLINAVTNVNTDPYATDPDKTAAAGKRTVVWCNLNDDIGDSVILTLNGTSKIPNCYGAEDEADQE